MIALSKTEIVNIFGNFIAKEQIIFLMSPKISNRWQRGIFLFALNSIYNIFRYIEYLERDFRNAEGVMPARCINTRIKLETLSKPHCSDRFDGIMYRGKQSFCVLHVQQAVCSSLMYDITHGEALETFSIQALHRSALVHSVPANALDHDE